MGILRVILIMIIGINVMAMSDREVEVLLDLKGATQKLSRNILLISIDYNYDKNKIKLRNLSLEINSKIKKSKSKLAKKLWLLYFEPIKLVLNDDINENMLEKLDKANRNLYLNFKSLNKRLNKKKFRNKNLITNQILKSERVGNSFIHLYRNFKTKKSLQDIDRLIREYDKDMITFNKTHITKKWKKIKPLLKQALELKDVELAKVLKKCNILSELMRRELKNKNLSDKNEIDRVVLVNQNIIKLSNLVKKVMKDDEMHTHHINILSWQINYIENISKDLIFFSLGIESKERQKNILELAYKLRLSLSEIFYSGRDLKIFDNLAGIRESWRFFNYNVKLALEGDKKAVSYILKNNILLSNLISESIDEYQRVNFQSNPQESLVMQKVELAGKLRFLTQKMTKERFLILGRFYPEQNRDNLSKSISKFNMIIAEFNLNSKNSALELKKVKQIWQELKPFYSKENLNDEEFHIILNKNIEFMNKIDDLVIVLKKSKI